jgi:hypothetical protein
MDTGSVISDKTEGRRDPPVPIERRDRSPLATVPLGPTDPPARPDVGWMREESPLAKRRALAASVGAQLPLAPAADAAVFCSESPPPVAGGAKGIAGMDTVDAEERAGGGAAEPASFSTPEAALPRLPAAACTAPLEPGR